MKKSVIIILFILLIPCVLFITRETDFVKKDKLYISEISTKNGTIIQDEDEDFPDFIEIYNGYGEDFNLEGYSLSDREFSPFKWTFPKITIKSHEYLVVFASGKNKCDLEKRICHTNFKLSSTGEKLVLTDKLGNLISKIKFDKMDRDVSYAFDGKKYLYTSKPTPGKENVIEEIKMYEKKTYTLRINEYMTHNKSSHYLADGSYYDFIELYNYSDNDMSLDGLFISTNKNKLTKFALPKETIKAHEYKVIYMTKGVKVDGYICANFGLSDLDTNIYISNGKDIYEELELKVLKDDVSYGLKDDKWYYFLTATPGRENTTKAYEEMP